MKNLLPLTLLLVWPTAGHGNESIRAATARVEKRVQTRLPAQRIAQINEKRTALAEKWLGKLDEALAAPSREAVRLLSAASQVRRDVRGIPLGWTSESVVLLSPDDAAAGQWRVNANNPAEPYHDRARPHDLLAAGVPIDSLRPLDAVRRAAEEAVLLALGAERSADRAADVAKAIDMQERGRFDASRDSAVWSVVTPLFYRAPALLESLDLAARALGSHVTERGRRVESHVFPLLEADDKQPAVGLVIERNTNRMQLAAGPDFESLRTTTAGFALDVTALAEAIDKLMREQAQKVVSREGRALAELKEWSRVGIAADVQKAHDARVELVDAEPDAGRSVWDITQHTRELAQQIFDTNRVRDYEQRVGDTKQKIASEFLRETRQALDGDKDTPLKEQIEAATALGPVRVFTSDVGTLELVHVGQKVLLHTGPDIRKGKQPTIEDLTAFPSIADGSADVAFAQASERALLSAYGALGHDVSDRYAALKGAIAAVHDGEVPGARKAVFERALGPWFKRDGLASVLLNASAVAQRLPLMKVAGKELAIVRHDTAAAFEIDGAIYRVGELAEHFGHDSLRLADLVEAISEAVDRTADGLDATVAQIDQRAAEL